jgi:hypothetical protein
MEKAEISNLERSGENMGNALTLSEDGIKKLLFNALNKFSKG